MHFQAVVYWFRTELYDMTSGSGFAITTRLTILRPAQGGKHLVNVEKRCIGYAKPLRKRLLTTIV